MKFRNFQILGLLICFCSCAPVVQSQKNTQHTFAPNFFHVVVQEKRYDSPYLRGMDSVAMHTLSNAGMSLSTYYNAFGNLEPTTMRRIRHVDSTGYFMILAIDSIIYQRGELKNRVYSATLFDLSTQDTIWSSHVFMRKPPTPRDPWSVCSTFVEQARIDGVLIRK